MVLALIRDIDGWLLAEGTHLRPYECLGAHPVNFDGVDGVIFSLWAPNAQQVSVVGEFNQWDGRIHPMTLRHEVGIWERFIPEAKLGQAYKYELQDSRGYMRVKADPYTQKRAVSPCRIGDNGLTRQTNSASLRQRKFATFRASLDLRSAFRLLASSSTQ